FAGDDAEEWRRFAHLLFFFVVWRRCQLVVITGLVPVIHVLASSPLARTWMAGTSPAMTDH
ncbi:MAG TPA: hypothetical protein VF901_14545, partial [Bradyrhizobium sp.]